MDYYYQGAWRMDWGFGNPNKTATLIACLMLAVWAGAFMWRRGFWFVLPIFTALGLCLVQTYSRGGMLAVLAGGAVLLIWAPRPWPRARSISVLAALWIIGLFVLYTRAESRYGQGLFSEDQSITSRLVIWQHFPGMLAAAPWGWGWGNAGDSYTQWFQPYSQSMAYLNLINSHFTWMAEGGWMFSAVYIWAWISVGMLCLPDRASRLGAVPLATWVALGVSGCFSHVEGSVWIWIVPIACLGWVLIQRARSRQWPSRVGFGLGALASTGAVAVAILIGHVNAEFPVRAVGNTVIIGEGVKQTVVYVDRAVMGKLYGHALREFLNRHHDLLSSRTYIITESPSYVASPGVEQVVVGGAMLRESQIDSPLAQSDKIVLINPDCFPEEMKWSLGSCKNVSVLFGEYSQSPSRSSWTSIATGKTLLIEGAGDFIPSWPEAVWKPAGT